MTSEPAELYVWIWLPKATEPVVAGVITPLGDVLSFNYGRSYLERPDAESIFSDELPLKAGRIEPTPPKKLAGCLRDAAPDAWGRRVILHRLHGEGAQRMDAGDLSELTYLFESGSDRIGRLDFQRSPSDYIARESSNASLEELQNAVSLVDAGKPLSKDLAAALQHGTAIGGARPKVLLDGSGKKYVAKFSSSTDIYPVVKYEYFAMRLAEICGLQPASVELVQSLGRDVLLVERFDRDLKSKGWSRRGMVSALTVLDLDEMEAPYASYSHFAQWLRANSEEPLEDLRLLYSRMVFNILCGNTDDHARNHAVFNEQGSIRLTPAYDICPQLRTGGEASQGMSIHGGQRLSQVKHCIEAANHFLLSEQDAKEIAGEQISIIENNWRLVADEANLSRRESEALWQRQLLNPFALEP